MPTPLPVIPDTYRVALNWQESGTGQTAVSVMHFRTSAPGSLATIAAQINGAFTLGMWDPVVSTASIVDMSITPLDGASATVTFGVGGGVNSGSSSGQFVPQVAELVKFQTAFRGRDNRGRIYLPFIAESASINGALNPASVSPLQTGWDNFKTVLDADSPVIGHVVAAYDRRHGGAGAHTNEVLHYFVETVLGTQRRRQGRLR